jgi:hypothetical protein
MKNPSEAPPLYRMKSMGDEGAKEESRVGQEERPEESLTEEEKPEVGKELIAQYKNLNYNDQHGVKELLRAMIQADWGEVPLGQAINKIGSELREKDWWTGGKGAKGNRAEAISLLSRRDEGRVGRLTVDEVQKILEPIQPSHIPG